MRKAKTRVAGGRGGNDILPEYDFSRGRRNKYAARYAEGSNVVVLDRDVAAVFSERVGGQRCSPCVGRRDPTVSDTAGPPATERLKLPSRRRRSRINLDRPQ
jgi:hypothetical protein